MKNIHILMLLKENRTVLSGVKENDGKKTSEVALEILKRRSRNWKKLNFVCLQVKNKRNDKKIIVPKLW